MLSSRLDGICARKDNESGFFTAQENKGVFMFCGISEKLLQPPEKRYPFHVGDLRDGHLDVR